MTLKAPFPYFGGKSRVAGEVWKRLGDVPNYIEPFFGSGAVLLARPEWHTGYIETVNDKDGFIANFWRAVRHDPQTTASFADWPVNENDLHARHAWLVGQKESIIPKLEGDPEWYDAKIAGWWVWGMSCWIGGGFCSGKGPWHVNENHELVHSVNMTNGVGVYRKRIRLCDTGIGVSRRRVHLGDAGLGVHRMGGVDIYQWFDLLAQRLRRVRVCCGDWKRVMGLTATIELGLTGIFLDPPYSQNERNRDLYSTDEDDIASEVREWCIANGNNPLYRIAFCGYEGEHIMPAEWTVYRWKSLGGYGLRGNGRGRQNRKRETIWFSPHCLKPDTPSSLL